MKTSLVILKIIAIASVILFLVSAAEYKFSVKYWLPFAVMAVMFALLAALSLVTIAETNLIIKEGERMK